MVLPQGKLWRVCLALQILVIVFISVKTASGTYGGHYGIFTSAGNWLLKSKNPYGVEWGFGGLWFYSPVCGWFFGLLSLLPHSIGLFIFNLISHAIFLVGMWKLLVLLGKKYCSNGYISLLIILSLGELIGAYQSFKLEMVIVGLLLICAEQISVRPIFSAAIAALLVNFKWFPIAPIGLLAVVEWKHRNYSFLWAFPLFLMGWFTLPVLVYGPSFAWELYQTQHTTLEKFVNEAYLHFPSIFGLLSHSFGISLPRRVVFYVLCGVAALLALIIYRSKEIYSLQKVFAVALGSLYVVNFNLLSQFNSYVIATPAVALALFLCFSLKGWERNSMVFVTAIYWIVVSMFYSDLVPHSFRDICRTLLVKPSGSFILLIAFLVWLVLNRKPWIALAEDH